MRDKIYDADSDVVQQNGYSSSDTSCRNSTASLVFDSKVAGMIPSPGIDGESMPRFTATFPEDAAASGFMHTHAGDHRGFFAPSIPRSPDCGARLFDSDCYLESPDTLCSAGPGLQESPDMDPSEEGALLRRFGDAPLGSPKSEPCTSYSLRRNEWAGEAAGGGRETGERGGDKQKRQGSARRPCTAGELRFGLSGSMLLLRHRLLMQVSTVRFLPSRMLCDTVFFISSHTILVVSVRLSVGA